MTYEELIPKILDGSESAFMELFDMYKDKVYATALVILRDPCAAEDILQETFLIIYKKIYSLKNIESFEGWLHKITINCCNSHLRKRKKHLLIDQNIFEATVNDISSDQPEKMYFEKQCNSELTKAIGKLTYKLRTCIVLYYFNEFTIKQISEILDCSEGTVKSRLFKGKRALERHLNLKNPKEVSIYGNR